MSIQKKAKRMLQFFEQKERDDKSKFYRLKDYDPDLNCGGETSFQTEKDKYQDIIHIAHGDMFPDDHKYRFIYNILCDLADMTDDAKPEDVIFEIESDSYTSDLTEWLNSNNSRIYYLTEVLEDMDIKDGFQALAWAQKKEIEEIAFSILNSLQKLEEKVV